MFQEKEIFVKGKKRKVYKSIYPNLSSLNDRLKELLMIHNNRSVTLITKVIRNNMKKGFTKIYTSDIQNFFNSIPHKYLLLLIKKNKNINAEVYQNLNSFLKSFSDSIEDNHGVPTGINIANTLSEYYLNELDKNMIDLSKRHNFKYARYVDNFIFMFRYDSDLFNDKSTHDSIMDIFNSEIEKLSLKLNYLQRVGIDSDSNFIEFDFLGFKHGLDKVSLSTTLIKNLKSSIISYLRWVKKTDDKNNASKAVYALNKLIIGHERYDKKNNQTTWVGLAKYLSLIDSFKDVFAFSKWIRKVAHYYFGEDASTNVTSLVKWVFIFKKNIKTAEIKAKHTDCGIPKKVKLDEDINSATTDKNAKISDEENLTLDHSHDNDGVNDYVQDDSGNWHERYTDY